MRVSVSGYVLICVDLQHKKVNSIKRHAVYIYRMHWNAYEERKLNQIFGLNQTVLSKRLNRSIHPAWKAIFVLFRGKWISESVKSS